MYCRYCGKELEDGATVCPSCGKKVLTAAAPEEETPAGAAQTAREPSVRDREEAPSGTPQPVRDRKEPAGAVPEGSAAEKRDAEKTPLLSEEERRRVIARVREERAEAERKAAQERQDSRRKELEEEDLEAGRKPARFLEREEPSAAADSARKPENEGVSRERKDEAPEKNDGTALSEEERRRIIQEVIDRRAEEERLAAEKRQEEDRRAAGAKEKTREAEKKAEETLREAADHGTSGSGAGTDTGARERGSGRRHPGIPAYPPHIFSSGESEYRSRGGNGGTGESGSRAEQGERTAEDKIARLSAALAVVSVFALSVPYAALPVGIMAFLFGVISIHRNTARRGSAVAGIVLGAAVIILACVLIWSTAALAPYGEQLIRIFQEYLNEAGQ